MFDSLLVLIVIMAKSERVFNLITANIAVKEAFIFLQSPQKRDTIPGVVSRKYLKERWFFVMLWEF